MAHDDAATLAWADALESWAATATTLAERLRATATPEPLLGDLEAGRGPRQRELLDLEALDTTAGMTAEQVAQALGVALPNAHKLLTKLEARELVQRIPESKPTRWCKTASPSTGAD